MSPLGHVRWVHVFIDVPPAAAPATRAFWSRVLGWHVGSPWREHPEFTSLEPPHGDSYVHVQEVADRPRVHLDLVADDLDESRDALRDLGARALQRTEHWQTMTSPGGLPFCLCRRPHDGVRPPGTQHQEGHRSRLAQVCIDVPAAVYDDELDFWHQVTGWRKDPVGRPEFVELVGPPSTTLRLLVQRLGPDDAGDATRAHIDLGADADVQAEAERLQRLGAQFVDAPGQWVVLTDPAGLPFCVTPKPAA
jgi:catechol 2,3-dioxygenase-like lactoylglutathione lyase family enzyme